MKTLNQTPNNNYISPILLHTLMSSNNTTTNSSQRNSHRIFQHKDNLFTTGDRFEGIYILRSGSAKSYMLSRNGEEHITKFYYPGDILGMDGFDENIHSQTIRFLETSSVCLIKESEVNSLLTSSDQFRKGFLKSMSHNLACDSSMLMCLSICSSEQKVARFLLDLSVGFSERNLSGSEFKLSMTRTDIANFLGMAIETVSRVFTTFQQKNIICVKQRYLSILDFASLNRSIAIDVCSPIDTYSSQHAKKVLN